LPGLICNFDLSSMVLFNFINSSYHCCGVLLAWLFRSCDSSSTRFDVHSEDTREKPLSACLDRESRGKGCWCVPGEYGDCWVGDDHTFSVLNLVFILALIIPKHAQSTYELEDVIGEEIVKLICADPGLTVFCFTDFCEELLIEELVVRSTDCCVLLAEFREELFFGNFLC